MHPPASSIDDLQSATNRTPSVVGHDPVTIRSRRRPHTSCMSRPRPRRVRLRRPRPRAGGGERGLEAPGVDGVAVRDEHVAGRAADDPTTGRVAVVEYVAQPRDIGLQCRFSSGRRIITPHRLDQPIDRDNLVDMDDQDRQESAEPRAAGGNDCAVVVDLDRTQHPILHRTPPWRAEHLDSTPVPLQLADSARHCA